MIKAHFIDFEGYTYTEFFTNEAEANDYALDFEYELTKITKPTAAEERQLKAMGEWK